MEEETREYLNESGKPWSTEEFVSNPKKKEVDENIMQALRSTSPLDT
jgi:hypothetical protein